jgi:hypothetical protein
VSTEAAVETKVFELAYVQAAAKPAGPVVATVAEFLAAEVGTTEYQLTGMIEDTYNTQYGNFYLNDGTAKVLVYGLTATKVEKNDMSFASLGLRDGDTVTLIGTRADYQGKAQVGGPAYYVSHVAAPFLDLANTTATVDAEMTEYKIALESNATWTAVASEGVTLDKDAGEGNAEVTMTVPANTANEAVTYTVTFTYGEKTATFTLTQKGVPAEGGEDVEEEIVDLTGKWTLGTNAYDNTSGSNKQTATINGVDYSNLLKLGASSKGGTATFTIPAGTTRLTYSAIAWKGKNVSLTFTIGDNRFVQKLIANVTATGNPKYNITSTDNDNYILEITVDTDTVVTVNSGSERALLWDLKAVVVK